jgi:uncharacterized lipoprotein YmbA
MTMRTTLLIAALLISAGCFKLGRVTPPLEQYVLGSTPPAATATTTRDSMALAIGMRRLDLARYLATPSIIVRRGALIETSEFRRWSEDPASGISRAVARYLAAEPRIGVVDVAPWSVRTDHDYVVQLHVTRMEGVAPADTAGRTGEVHLMATWEIIRPADGILIARGETDRRENAWRVGDYAALVAQLDRGLMGLARDLATCLAQIGRTVSPITPPVAVGRPLNCAPVRD